MTDSAANKPRPARRVWRPLLLFALGALLLLGAGAARMRAAYLTRGTVEGLPNPIKQGGAEIGLNVDLRQLDEGRLVQTLERIADAGVRHVKQPFYYETPFDWEATDHLLASIHEAGLQATVLLDGSPDDYFAPPADLAAFAFWAGAFAQRYGQYVRHYVIWDEPNLSSHWGGQPVNPAEYAALLSASADAVRQADNDAIIVAAPLAPTSETGPRNVADHLYLRQLYAVGAGDVFDVAAAKPYGFHSGPGDRNVDPAILNFSRVILLREVMQEHGDDDKAIFAGNWGWNALPADWQGPPSLWGQTNAQTRVIYTRQAFDRARREWPWMGLMFLEIWQSPTPRNNPHHGFDIEGTVLEEALPGLAATTEFAFPGFHAANAHDPAQTYDGGWRFSPLYGADIGETGDRATLRFWGDAVGVRVRRADYRARFYVTVDGQPAPGLPNDGTGAALVLTAPEIDVPADYLDTVTVAENLSAGPHTMVVEAYRGWDQWALNGFSVGFHPPVNGTRVAATVFFGGALIVLFIGAIDLRRSGWGQLLRDWLVRYERLSDRARVLLTVLAGGLVALTGWLTWGEQAAGLYRRLGDGGQLAVTAAAASLFYGAPALLVYVPALLLLFFLVYARPAWGLVLVAFSFPFYVLPRPMAGYRFSPVEIFVILTAAAVCLAYAGQARRKLIQARRAPEWTLPSPSILLSRLRRRLVQVDYAVAFFAIVATASLLFTDRLDVAQNEWRVVVIEPVLFYFLLRTVRPTSKEMWAIIDAFVLGGVAVAVYGLWRYAFGLNVITVAGGLARLRSIYGSPNNVALYLGRVVPFLFAVALLRGASRRRRLLYGVALAPVGAAILLTFSKGALFLGIPAGIGMVLFLWLRISGRRLWPWLVGGAGLLIAAVATLFAVPSIAARLDVQGVTSVMRLSLWQASLNMFADHPLIGVGLDNFLYAYRGRYILDAGWQEPRLNHPHNIILDFATRLGIAGLIAGGWLFASLLKGLWQLPKRLGTEWRPIAVAAAGSVAQMVAHGMVDHSFFLVDLAFVYFFLLGLVVWLRQTKTATSS